MFTCFNNVFEITKNVEHISENMIKICLKTCQTYFQKYVPNVSENADCIPNFVDILKLLSYIFNNVFDIIKNIVIINLYNAKHILDKCLICI